MGLSRRDLMKKAGMAAVGTGFAGLSLAVAGKAIGAGEQNKIPDLPWPYKKLDPVAVAEAAYQGYCKGGYGDIESIIAPLQEIGRFSLYDDASRPCLPWARAVWPTWHPCAVV